MKKLLSILFVVLTFTLVDATLLNGNLFIKDAQATCNVKVKRYGVYHSVFRCDSTPNETCSAEGSDSEGNEYNFSCDGAETYRHEDFGGAPV